MMIQRLALAFAHLVAVHGSWAAGATDPAIREQVNRKVAAEYPSLEVIYRELHARPELSFMESNTAALVARELRSLGFAVTEKVGNTGVVGVLTNGTGPTVLLRADMDALPIKEETGLSYASTGLSTNLSGQGLPAMHACAHDAHITSLIGAARTLRALTNHWAGTLVLIAQPAEEIGAGARAMLADGLFSRFPLPDFALTLHAWGPLPAGVIGYAEGPSYANVDTLDILVRGYGGHGSRPHLAKDPIVLASEIVLMLQTIVSRELEPGTPAVVTVGSIHGGTKHNIIPDEVRLQLTLRSYSDAVADHLVRSIERICANLARAAGIPEDRLPVISHAEQRLPLVDNNPMLTRRLAATFQNWFGQNQVLAEKPTTGGEDFGLLGRTSHRVPVFAWWVGAQDPARLDAAKRGVTPLASNHSALFAPVPEPTIKTSILSFCAAVLDLMPAR
ncbi:MAG: amidohydrolase [Verrucomicrobiales bacterium]|nr:amidohydrolase [Verrucomicrobiales bacterium]